MNAGLLDPKVSVILAELGSFVRTTKPLNLSQPALPAVGRRIQKLDEALGAERLKPIPVSV